MGGVLGWWDETADPEVESALDALVQAGAPDEVTAGEELVDAQDVDEPVEEKRIVIREDVEALKQKVMTPTVKNPSITTGTTYTWQWEGLSGATGTSNPITYTAPHLDIMAITKGQYETFKKQEKALKALTIAAGQLAEGVGGLPSKEYKPLKAAQKLVAEVLSEINKDRLV